MKNSRALLSSYLGKHGFWESLSINTSKIQWIVTILAEKHRIIKKNFETELRVDGNPLPLNHMMQETLGNILTGFAKTLKGADENMEKIEVKIKRLHQNVDVDAHTYQ